MWRQTQNFTVQEGSTLRIRLVGGVEKWEDRKWWKDRKEGGQKRF